MIPDPSGRPDKPYTLNPGQGHSAHLDAVHKRRVARLPALLQVLLHLPGFPDRRVVPEPGPQSLQPLEQRGPAVLPPQPFPALPSTEDPFSLKWAEQ